MCVWARGDERRSLVRRRRTGKMDGSVGERAASIRESEGRWARALSGRGPGWAKRGVVSLQNRAGPLQHHEIRQVPGRGTSQGS